MRLGSGGGCRTGVWLSSAAAELFLIDKMNHAEKIVNQSVKMRDAYHGIFAGILIVCLKIFVKTEMIVSGEIANVCC